MSLCIPFVPATKFPVTRTTHANFCVHHFMGVTHLRCHLLGGPTTKEAEEAVFCSGGLRDELQSNPNTPHESIASRRLFFCKSLAHGGKKSTPITHLFYSSLENVIEIVRTMHMHIPNSNVKPTVPVGYLCITYDGVYLALPSYHVPVKSNLIKAIMIANVWSSSMKDSPSCSETHPYAALAMMESQ
jgi:hypothetical protein